MKKLVLQGLTLVFAVGVLGALVFHATMTSGCSKPESVAKDPTPAAPSALVTPVASVPAAAAVSAPKEAEPPKETAASASPSAPAPSASAPKKPTPAKPAGSLNPPPHFGGSKSGIIVRPSDIGQGASGL